jgi:hypothetical protein
MANLPIPRGYAGQTNRAIGTLHRSELWWKDQYYDLKHIGYDLRPRYHPDWEPSWIRSGNDFFSVEDGQPSIVRVYLVVSIIYVYE